MSDIKSTYAQLRLWEAVDRALAARVPLADRVGTGSEPVTVSGYYRVPTVSGRDAWARYQWVDGRLWERCCTYDPQLEENVLRAIIDGGDPSIPRPRGD